MLCQADQVNLPRKPNNWPSKRPNSNPSRPELGLGRTDSKPSKKADLALDEFFGGIATEPRLSGGVSMETPSPAPKTAEETTQDSHGLGQEHPSQPIPVNMNLVDKVVDYQRDQEFLKQEVPDEWTTDAVAFIQSQDRDLSKVREWLRPGKPPPTWQDVVHENAAVKAWWGRLEQLHFLRMEFCT